MQNTRSFLRSVSIVLLQSFILQQISFADVITPSKHNVLSKPEVGLSIPESVAMVEDAYKAKSADRGPQTTEKTIYLLQDAHTNESAQYNLAKTLDIILKKENSPQSTDHSPQQTDRDGLSTMDRGLKFVFTEAGIGDNSLTFLRPFRPLSERTQLAKSYIKKGILHGAEYLDLTSDHSFTLWGVENPDLYAKAIEDYKAVAQERDRFAMYLKKIDATLETLKSRLMNPALQTFDKESKLYHQDKLALTEYFQALLREATLRNISLDQYPHLNKLKDLKAKEEKLDFQKANEEHLKAVQSLSLDIQQELKELSQAKAGKVLQNKKEERAYFQYLEEKLEERREKREEGSYQELTKYFQYLKLAKGIQAKEILMELKAFEANVFSSLTQSEDEKLLIQSEKMLGYLNKLFRFTLTPDEFKEYKELSSTHNIEHFTGFLNKKIMELETYYDRALFLEKGYEDMVQHAESFYALTNERDAYFLTAALEKMDKENQDKAVLITGGFHTTNLKEMLKQKNISFVSITPQVLQETNIKKYESILLGQVQELKSATQQLVFNSTAAMTMQGFITNLTGVPAPAGARMALTDMANYNPIESILDARLVEQRTEAGRMGSRMASETFKSLVALSLVLGICTGAGCASNGQISAPSTIAPKSQGLEDGIIKITVKRQGSPYVYDIDATVWIRQNGTLIDIERQFPSASNGRFTDRINVNGAVISGTRGIGGSFSYTLNNNAQAFTATAQGLLDLFAELTSLAANSSEQTQLNNLTQIVQKMLAGARLATKKRVPVDTQARKMLKDIIEAGYSEGVLGSLGPNVSILEVFDEIERHSSAVLDREYSTARNALKGLFGENAERNADKPVQALFERLKAETDLAKADIKEIISHHRSALLKNLLRLNVQELTSSFTVIKKRMDQAESVHRRTLKAGARLSAESAEVTKNVGIGINGAGRIGVNLVVAWLQSPYAANIVAMNDVSFNFKANDVKGVENFVEDILRPGLQKIMGYLGAQQVDLKYGEDNGKYWISINGHKIRMTDEPDPAKLAWDEVGATGVFEGTGRFTDAASAGKHLEAGAQKVFITAPATGKVTTIVAGVNLEAIKRDENINSCASCTTGSIVPVLKVLSDKYGIKRGFLVTTHAYTNDQGTHDLIRPGAPERGRAAAMNIIESGTGAAKAVAEVLPELKGKLDGFALRVPVLNGSVSVLALELETNVTADEINATLKEAAEGELKGIMAYTSRKFVSSDILGRLESSIVHGSATKVIGGNFVQLEASYDNEYGYTNRAWDTAASVMGIAVQKADTSSSILQREIPPAVIAYIEQRANELRGGEGARLATLKAAKVDGIVRKISAKEGIKILNVRAQDRNGISLPLVSNSDEAEGRSNEPLTLISVRSTLGVFGFIEILVGAEWKTDRGLVPQSRFIVTKTGDLAIFDSKDPAALAFWEGLPSWNATDFTVDSSKYSSGETDSDTSGARMATVRYGEREVEPTFETRIERGPSVGAVALSSQGILARLTAGKGQGDAYTKSYVTFTNTADSTEWLDPIEVGSTHGQGSISLIPKSSYLVFSDGSTSRFSKLAVWNLATKALEWEKSGITKYKVSNDGKYIAVMRFGAENVVTVVEAVTGKVVSEIDLPDLISDFDFSQDGQTLAVGYQKSVAFFSALDGSPARGAVTSETNVSQVFYVGAFYVGNYNQMVATLTVRNISDNIWNDTVNVWNSLTGKLVSSFDVSGHSSLAAAPSKPVFAVSRYDGLTLVDALTGRTISRMELEQDEAKSIAFSPDGEFLLSHKDRTDESVIHSSVTRLWPVEELLTRGARLADLATLADEIDSVVARVGVNFRQLSSRAPKWADLERFTDSNNLRAYVSELMSRASQVSPADVPGTKKPQAVDVYPGSFLRTGDSVILVAHVYSDGTGIQFVGYNRSSDGKVRAINGRVSSFSDHTYSLPFESRVDTKDLLVAAGMLAFQNIYSEFDLSDMAVDDSGNGKKNIHIQVRRAQGENVRVEVSAIVGATNGQIALKVPQDITVQSIADQIATALYGQPGLNSEKASALIRGLEFVQDFKLTIPVNGQNRWIVDAKDSTYGEGARLAEQGSKPNFLQKGWVMSNHILMSFHMAFLSGLVQGLYHLAGEGTRVDLKTVGMLLGEDLLTTAFVAFASWHVTIAVHEMGHYFTALRKNLISGQEVDLEKGANVRLIDYAKAFFKIPYGKFAGIVKDAGGYHPDVKMPNLAVEAAGPVWGRNLSRVTLIPGLLILGVGMVLVAPFAPVVGYGLALLGRFFFSAGVVSYLDITRTDNDAYRKFKEQTEGGEKGKAIPATSTHFNHKEMKQTLIDHRMAVVHDSKGNVLQLPWQYRNTIQGGRHVEKQGGNVSFQEFMLIPKAADLVTATAMVNTIQDRVLWIMRNSGSEAGLQFIGNGIEGGVVGTFKGYEEQVLDVLMQATRDSGFVPGEDIFFALDVAASELSNAFKEAAHSDQKGRYTFWMRTDKTEMSAVEFVDYLETLVNKYPIISIEDGMSEDDWDGWALLKERLGERVLLVGDDLVTTNEDTIYEANEKGVIDSVLVKANQIGSVAETILAVLASKISGNQVIVSHRSKSGLDDFEASFALAWSALGAKMGGAKNAERQQKYNRLLAEFDLASRRILTPAFEDDVTIIDLSARQVPTNEGQPTVEVTVRLSNGAEFVGVAPVGSSAGSGEAVHLIDMVGSKADPQKNNTRAVENVNKLIAPIFVGKKISEIGGLWDVDAKLLALEAAALDKAGLTAESVDAISVKKGIQRKANMGMNAILPSSLALSKALAASKGLRYWEYIRQVTDEVAGDLNQSRNTLYNLDLTGYYNGGRHAKGSRLATVQSTIHHDITLTYSVDKNFDIPQDLYVAILDHAVRNNFFPGETQLTLSTETLPLLGRRAMSTVYGAERFIVHGNDDTSVLYVVKEPHRAGEISNTLRAATLVLSPEIIYTKTYTNYNSRRPDLFVEAGLPEDRMLKNLDEKEFEQEGPRKALAKALAEDVAIMLQPGSQPFPVSNNFYIETFVLKLANGAYDVRFVDWAFNSTLDVQEPNDAALFVGSILAPNAFGRFGQAFITDFYAELLSRVPSDAPYIGVIREANNGSRLAVYMNILDKNYMKPFAGEFDVKIATVKSKASNGSRAEFDQALKELDAAIRGRLLQITQFMMTGNAWEPIETESGQSQNIVMLSRAFSNHAESYMEFNYNDGTYKYMGEDSRGVLHTATTAELVGVLDRVSSGIGFPSKAQGMLADLSMWPTSRKAILSERSSLYTEDNYPDVGEFSVFAVRNARIESAVRDVKTLGGLLEFENALRAHLTDVLKKTLGLKEDESIAKGPYKGSSYTIRTTPGDGSKETLVYLSQIGPHTSSYALQQIIIALRNEMKGRAEHFVGGSRLSSVSDAQKSEATAVLIKAGVDASIAQTYVAYGANYLNQAIADGGFAGDSAALFTRFAQDYTKDPVIYDTTEQLEDHARWAIGALVAQGARLAAEQADQAIQFATQVATLQISNFKPDEVRSFVVRLSPESLLKYGFTYDSTTRTLHRQGSGINGIESVKIANVSSGARLGTISIADAMALKRGKVQARKIALDGLPAEANTSQNVGVLVSVELLGNIGQDSKFYDLLSDALRVYAQNPKHFRVILPEDADVRRAVDSYLIVLAEELKVDVDTLSSVFDTQGFADYNPVRFALPGGTAVKGERHLFISLEQGITDLPFDLALVAGQLSREQLRDARFVSAVKTSMNQSNISGFDTKTFDLVTWAEDTDPANQAFYALLPVIEAINVALQMQLAKMGIRQAAMAA